MATLFQLWSTDDLHQNYLGCFFLKSVLKWRAQDLNTNFQEGDIFNKSPQGIAYAHKSLRTAIVCYNYWEDFQDKSNAVLHDHNLVKGRTT